MAYVPPHRRATAAAADSESELVAVTRSLAELGFTMQSDTASHGQQQRGDAHFDVNREQKHLRTLCWQALQKDNPEHLFKAIDEGVATFGIDAPGLMVKLENLLWKNSKWHGRSNGEGEDDPPRGLIAVAAGNRREYRLQERSNVSLRLRRLPTDYSIDQHIHIYAVAMRRAERKGRLWALALLRAFLSAHANSCRCNFPSRMYSRSGSWDLRSGFIATIVRSSATTTARQ